MLHTISFHASLLGRQLDEKVKSTNAHVLIYGAVEVHSFGEKGCIASNETIGTETGMTKNTVAKCLSQMAKAGWIEVYIRNGKRISITPLLVIQPPLPHGKPPFTVEKTPLYHMVNIDNSIDKIEITVENIEKPKNTDEVPLIIKAFEEIDPKNKTYYGHKGQRSACTFLIKEYGLDSTIEAIEFLKGIYSREVLPEYFPSINSPYDLKEKWTKVQQFVKRLQTQKIKETNSMIW